MWLKDGLFYWAEDSGCSCNGPWDMTEFPEAFEGHGTAHEAIRALHRWASAQYTSETSESLLMKLLDYRPEKPAA